MKIKDIITDNIIKNHIICNNVLSYTNESTEAKVERFVNLCTKIINVH